MVLGKLGRGLLASQACDKDQMIIYWQKCKLQTRGHPVITTG